METISDLDRPFLQRWPWSLCAASLMLALVWLSYRGALESPFFFDDAGAVVNNATIRDLGSLQVLQPPPDGSTTTGRPLVNLSFAIDYYFGGLSPARFHTTNLLLHMATGLLLWRWLVRLQSLRGLTATASTRPRVSFAAGELLPFFAALLWALHPLQTETVVCVAQRTEGLWTLFLVACLWAATRHFDPGSRAPRLWAVLCFFFCALGMAAKEVMFVAPLLVLLLDCCLARRGPLCALRARPCFYAALFACWLLLAALLLGGGGTRGVSAGLGLGVSSWDYFTTQWWALVHYLRLSLWPHPLAVDYGTALFTDLGSLWWRAVLLTLLFLASLWALRRHPLAGFAGLAFFLVLGPSSSFVPLVSQTIAEHRMYAPLACLVALAVLGAGQRFPRFTALLAAALGAAAAYGTVLRVRDFRDEVSVWESSVRAFPRGARSHNNLGVALRARGETRAAEQSFRRALEADPLYPGAHYNLGALLAGAGRHAEALAPLSDAARLAPGFDDARIMLANTLVHLGRHAEALPHYRAVLGRAPSPDVMQNLALCLQGAGRTGEALAQFQELLRLQPGNAEAWFRTGSLQLGAGRNAEAERSLLECLRHDASHLPARRALGLLYAKTERLEPAEKQFLELLARLPRDVETLGNLGNVALFRGQLRKAISYYEQALALDPSNKGLRANMAVAREALSN